ncbi:hypothetical protein BpHYR1_015409 [Brachionus plicatilis]|uniref:Uncharacterized protein n=1 Tax=Brachionus plicatilis TaxID=10195 RepID=A0A3M7PNA4_BRAPC|nr:hypothetical protein BpHYR1_015409 [Brachionus plicatilis]
MKLNFEIIGESSIISTEKLKEMLNKIKEEDGKNNRKGICESIKYCLEKIEERKEELKLLTQSIYSALH